MRRSRLRVVSGEGSLVLDGVGLTLLSPSKREALRSFLAPETTLWQYMHGVPDVTAISSDCYSLDNFYLARPGRRRDSVGPVRRLRISPVQDQGELFKIAVFASIVMQRTPGARWHRKAQGMGGKRFILLEFNGLSPSLWNAAPAAV